MTALPTWPNERDLARYAELTELDFAQELSTGKTWIDIGCRTGKALSQAAKQYRIIPIGVNAHDIAVCSGIDSIFAAVPDDDILYDNYKGSADLGTDIYGAVSYCDNPLNALIYEACLLKPNAKLVIVTLEDRMVASSIDVFTKIQHFFTVTMKQSISFQCFISYSDNSKSIVKNVRIIITGKPDMALSLHELFVVAENTIGKMARDKVIYQSLDQTAQIWQTRYRHA